jgi:hypothetical protein
MISPNPYMQPAPVVMPNPLFNPTGLAEQQPMPQMNAPQQELNQLSPQMLGAALQNYSGNDQNMPINVPNSAGSQIGDTISKMFDSGHDRGHKDNLMDRIDQASKIYDDYQSGGMDKALGGMLGPKSYANVKPMTDMVITGGNAIGNAAGKAYKGVAGIFK